MYISVKIDTLVQRVICVQIWRVAAERLCALYGYVDICNNAKFYLPPDFVLAAISFQQSWNNKSRLCNCLP